VTGPFIVNRELIPKLPLRRAIQIAKDEFGPKQPLVAECLVNLATVYAGVGRYSEAGGWL
jgi:hypothetical protein